MVFGIEVGCGLLIGIAAIMGAWMLAIRPELRRPKKDSWIAPPLGNVDDYKFGGMGPND